MSLEQKTITIVGAGLAGSECALQLAHAGYKVHLIEMRGTKETPAHKTTDCAELVCSNSFGSFSRLSAPGQLKWEAEQLNSFILEKGFETRVPAGQALGMDRELFAQKITEAIQSHPNITLERRVVNSLEELPRPCVIATGPLTDDNLAQSIRNHFKDENSEKDFLYFFDAIAPIVDADTLNFDVIWKADRYDRGTGDYLNCPMNKEQYYAFIEAVKSARVVEAKNFEKDIPYFESCMPIEEIIRRGDETIRFGPLSPKGLRQPGVEQRPYAVVQLRQDNTMGTAYNMVGFQTKMAYSEQVRIFRMIPGLENAEFLKLGSIHRNLYIHTPELLNTNMSSKKDPQLFFAGQITGVEGYFESAVIGLYVAQQILAQDQNQQFELPPRTTALGALVRAITEPKEHFQPTNINFGLMPPPAKRLHKFDKRIHHTQRARKDFSKWLEQKKPAVITQRHFDQFAHSILSDEEKRRLSLPMELTTLKDISAKEHGQLQQSPV